MHETAVDVWTESLKGEKSLFSKYPDMREWGKSTEAKIWFTKLVQVWMSVGEYRDCKSKRTICKKVLNNYSSRPEWDLSQ